MNILRLFLPLLLILVMGCGDGRVHLPTAPAAGVVTYRGKPLSKGRIIFVHLSGQAVATDLAADGTFNLAAFQGKNQVAIECCAPDQPKPNPNSRFALAVKSLIPVRYTEPGTSGLTLDVKSGEKNEAKFALED
jgi:hypothetical protein